jgi:hypothetical protein
LGIEEYMGDRYLEAASVTMRGEERVEMGDERLASPMSGLLQTEEFEDLIASTNEFVRSPSEEPLLNKGGQSTMLAMREQPLTDRPLLYMSIIPFQGPF